MSAQNQRAATPPQGWNSYDCYGVSVTEAEVRATSAYMAKHLRPYGWQYVVIDAEWYDATRIGPGSPPKNPMVLSMDTYGRLIPDPGRFPSAAGGTGLLALADAIHALGLQFGIHIMRGIPRRAVAENIWIAGTSYRADEIALPERTCPWNVDMFGVNMAHPGGQAYYDSMIALYASWGVDYLKVDDIASPYYADEIEGIAHAIQRCGREIVLSLSPGNTTPIEHIDHLQAHCELWRVSPDLWDQWVEADAPRTFPVGVLADQFARAALWATYAGPGHWPDLDMLPLGRLGPRPPVGEDRYTQLTHDEQMTMLTLWAISQAPLMIGGDLLSLDTDTLTLLTNPAILAVNQHGARAHELFRHGEQIAWVADAPDGMGKTLALFNLGSTPTSIAVVLEAIGIDIPCSAYNLWRGSEQSINAEEFASVIHPHGAGLFHLVPQQRLEQVQG